RDRRTEEQMAMERSIRQKEQEMREREAEARRRRDEMIKAKARDEEPTGYVSKHRRRPAKPAPQEAPAKELEGDLLGGGSAAHEAPAQQPSRNPFMPQPASKPTAPSPTPSRASPASAPARKSIPPRPNISCPPSSLQASATSRPQGSAAFKRGDYSQA